VYAVLVNSSVVLYAEVSVGLRRIEAADEAIDGAGFLLKPIPRPRAHRVSEVIS
jgi:hypothetical protein